jgi:predicted GIY-YIG superfamily endonuclease
MSYTMTEFEMLPFGGGIDADQEEIRRRAAGGAAAASRGPAGLSRHAGGFSRTGSARTTFPGSLGAGSPGRRHRWHGPRGYVPGTAGVEVPVDDAGSPGQFVARAGTPPSEQIRWIQFSLNSALNSNLPTDGIMSPDLRAALRTFQGQHGLPASGFVGPDTIAALQNAGGQQSGGQQSGAAPEGAEFEYLGELESAKQEAEAAARAVAAEPAREAAEAVLANVSQASSIQKAVKDLGSTARKGLYRLIDPNGRFYTGMSVDLRPRILNHAWCLSHLGKSVKPWRVTVYQMPGADKTAIRNVEWAINRYHEANPKRLNKQTELELFELGLM